MNSAINAYQKVVGKMVNITGSEIIQSFVLV